MGGSRINSAFIILREAHASMRYLWIAQLLCVIVGPGVLRAESASANAPVPSAEAVAASMKTIQQVYKDDIARAKSSEQKVTLSKKFLHDAIETTNDPTGRYALLGMARDTAADAGETDVALAALDEMSNAYRIDALDAAMSTLAKLARSAGVTNAQQFFLRSDGLIDAAVAADRYDLAERAAELANSAAQKSRESDLPKQTQKRAADVREIKAAFGEYTKSLARLKPDPADSEASLEVGRFLCFMKGNWDQGLPILAAGSDPALKSLAAREISGAADVQSQIALGDGWWDSSEKAVGVAKTQTRLHAAKWYQIASPGLSGLSKAKVEGRLRQVRNEIEGPGWLDLLPLVDPHRHALRGAWEVRDAKLTGGRGDWDSIILPVVPNGDYRIHVGFKRLEGSGDVAVLFPVGTSRECFILSAYNGDVGGLVLLQGRDEGERPDSVRPSRLENGRQYELQIQVTLKGHSANIDVTLDGKTYYTWAGPQSDLSSAGYIQPTKPALGLGGFRSVIEFNDARLQMIHSKAEPIETR